MFAAVDMGAMSADDFSRTLVMIEAQGAAAVRAEPQNLARSRDAGARLPIRGDARSGLLGAGERTGRTHVGAGAGTGRGCRWDGCDEQAAAIRGRMRSV